MEKEMRETAVIGRSFICSWLDVWGLALTKQGGSAWRGRKLPCSGAWQTRTIDVVVCLFTLSKGDGSCKVGLYYVFLGKQN